MNKQQAIERFKAEILPHLDPDDIPMVTQEWNDWTDALCKAGEITERQYSSWSNPF